MRKKGLLSIIAPLTPFFFPKFSGMKLFRVFTAIIFSGIVCSAFAQDEYPAETDSAWIASQNGGSTELNDGNDEPNPDCIGDGCGEATAEPTTEQASNEAVAESATEKPKNEGTDSDEEEDCTPADSLLPECKDSASETKVASSDDDDDDDDTYDRYTNENADISRASREGFSSGFSLGFRFGGGFNLFFIGEETDDWRIGYEATAGIIAQTKLGIEGLFASVGLSFSYFRYRYEADFEFDDYSEEDEAKVNVALFEIPVIIKYAIGGGNITLGLGFDLGLKLTGSSDFDQTINTSTTTEQDDTHDNTLPTAGLEMGAVLEIGYIVNKNVSVDLRVIQRFTNLLNSDVVFESSVKDAKLLGTHATIGISLFL